MSFDTGEGVVGLIWKIGSQPQKGITTYSLSPNRQRPFAGAMRAAVFNTSRRFYGQVFYWAPPMIGMYFLLDWANHRSEL